MHRAIVVGLVAAALGCSSPAPVQGVDGGSGDAPSGDGDGGSDDIDAPPGVGGLSFDLVVDPALPSIAATVSVDEIRVWLRDVRVIGDSAPGDSRTSLAELDLDFQADRDPPAVAFPLAPPGHYSQLAARLGRTDGSQSFEIRGHVTFGGQTYELDIKDESSADVAVALSVGVENQPVNVGIALDLSFLAGIDWSTAPHDSDKISLDEGSPITAAVRADLAAAFHAE